MDPKADLQAAIALRLFVVCEIAFFAWIFWRI